MGMSTQPTNCFICEKSIPQFTSYYKNYVYYGRFFKSIPFLKYEDSVTFCSKKCYLKFKKEYDADRILTLAFENNSTIFKLFSCLIYYILCFPLILFCKLLDLIFNMFDNLKKIPFEKNPTSFRLFIFSICFILFFPFVLFYKLLDLILDKLLDFIFPINYNTMEKEVKQHGIQTIEEAQLKSRSSRTN